MSGGGPSSSQINTSNQLTQQQLGISQQELDLANRQDANSQATQAEAKAQMQPYIAQQTALATGDRTEALKASLPAISKLSGGYNAAKSSILDSIPPGAARDLAVARLAIDKNVGIAGAQASAVQQAPQALAAIGSGQEAFGLQQLGAALSGYGGAVNAGNSAANINYQAEEAQNAAKANQLGFIGGLAGSAASAVSPIKISDARLKRKRGLVGSVLDRIRSLNVWNFDYINGPQDQIGVMAQEAMVEFPQIVVEGKDYYGVDYGAMSAIAIAAIQELTAEVDFLKARLATLESKG